ncbi:MAG TPA: ABC transporter permease [Symbiobacteriaceae bacterium]|nr:ABC transporter permease [Symbiobacteriaceae bacterium]
MKRLLQSIGWELAGMGLLVAFVVLLATMPPLEIRQAPAAPLGYTVQVDTATWQTTLQRYCKMVLSGTLGKGHDGNPVGPIVSERLGNSLLLVGISLVIAVFLGAVKGVWDFMQLRRGRVAIGPILTGLVQGLPDFWLVLLVQIGTVLIYNRFGWKPFPPAWVDSKPVASMVFPVFCLSLIPWAYVARITSTALVTVYDQEYVRTARAKGLHERIVMYKHALGSALVPILDNLPNALAVMFSNLLVVETMLHYPGVTILLKDAVAPLGARYADPRLPPPHTDVTTLVAAGVSLGLIFAVLFLTISILRRVFDPRLKERDIK